LLIQCHVCERKRCKSCINRDEEVWSTGESGDSVCPSCDVSMPHYRLMSWWRWFPLFACSASSSMPIIWL
jgi:hypothetical protein